MDAELLIARIISGTIPIKVGDRRFLISNASRLNRYYAEEAYLEAYAEAEAEGLYDEDDALTTFLISRNLWSEEEEKKLLGLPKDIETMKEQLYESRLQSATASTLRMHINRAREMWEGLYTKRHAYDTMACAGYAALAKGRYLIGSGLRTAQGKRVFRHESFWKDQSGLLEAAVGAYAATRLPDSTLRKLARKDPWRGLWANKRSEGAVFGKPVVDLTEEQRSLVGWSCLYDSINEHSERPPTDVIEDDDMLDGWLSIQRKKSEGQATAASTESLIKNERIKNSQEVFIMADTPEDARKVEALNDQVAQSTKRSRLKKLAKEGEVSEWNMPDTKLKIQMQANQMGIQTK